METVPSSHWQTHHHLLTLTVAPRPPVSLIKDVSWLTCRWRRNTSAAARRWSASTPVFPPEGHGTCRWTRLHRRTRTLAGRWRRRRCRRPVCLRHVVTAWTPDASSFPYLAEYADLCTKHQVMCRRPSTDAHYWNNLARPSDTFPPAAWKPLWETRVRSVLGARKQLIGVKKSVRLKRTCTGHTQNWSGVSLGPFGHSHDKCLMKLIQNVWTVVLVWPLTFSPFHMFSVGFMSGDCLTDFSWFLVFPSFLQLCSQAGLKASKSRHRVDAEGYL